MKKALIISLLVILVLGLTTYFTAVYATYSDGYRAGTVMKVSKKGVFFKTLEGQLNMGGMAGSEGSDVASTVWSFSVTRGDDDVIKSLEDAVDNGARVKLYYEEKFFQFDWRGDTKYFVYKVEQVGTN